MSSSERLLHRLLEQAGGASETGYLLVIDGEGLESLPAQMGTSKGSYGVHRVGSELGLRHLLWRAKGAPLIAVMPEEVARRIQQAPDLLRRARNQRVHALSVNDVLEVVLGVRVVGADAPHMQQLAMENVDRLGLAMTNRTLPTVVDRRLLTELLVDVSVGDQVRTKSPAQLLAMWAQEPPSWSPNVSKLVREAMPTMHGDEGRLLAWALAEPDTRLRDLIIHGAVLTVDEVDLPQPAWGPLWKAAAEAPISMERSILRRTVARMAEEALGLLGDGGSVLLDGADGVGRATLTPAQLQTSRVLPLAFSDRCHLLARQASKGTAISAADISWLATHRAARKNRSDLAVLEAMARVSRYLAEPFSPKTDLLEQVQDYQRGGAFVDLSMIQLRRALASNGQFQTEAKKLLALCRERRDLENRQFAETLAGGYEAALHREGLTPLHRLWKRTVAPVWQSKPDARLFLVVLDGCSYPVFLELLHALSQDSSFPLGIKPDASGFVTGMPALSPLPTVTSHARGAIFLGELPNDPLVAETVFRDQDEAKTDKARFNQNAALGGRTRKLFLKGDLADNGQALSHTLEDDSVSVVGVVFNAVDDQIGSSNTGAIVKISPEDIVGFKPALQKAITSGRRVLITADHGHSLYFDNSLRVGHGKTPRYTAIGNHDAVPEGFIEIDIAGLGGPAERRAFAWRSGAYLGGPQVGFHGGAGLEEVVVPLAWLERDGLYADEPSWWYGRGPLAAVAPAAAAVPTAVVTPQTSDEAPASTKTQLFLFNAAGTADSLPLPAAVIAQLNGDEKAILVLLRQTGSARASELAANLKKNPGRVNGLMVALRRTLHTAGHVIFTDEKLPSGETMYRYLAKKEGG